MTNNNQAVEFRGCDNLVIAQVLADDVSNRYSTGVVTVLAPVAEIAKTVESSSETHYYDNVGMITIRAEGTDEVTLTVPVLPLSTLAYITGKSIDAATGAFIDGAAVERYFAIGYRLKLTDGTYRYVWRLKGTFGFPDETSATEDDGTDTNNQELTFTGVQTVTEFTNGGRSRAIVIDERNSTADLSTFFDEVQTPDTIGSLATVTSVTVSPTTASVNVGDTTTISSTVTVKQGADPVSVTWTSSNTAVATVSGGGIVTGVSVGTATITATAGGRSAECTVTVAES